MIAGWIATGMPAPKEADPRIQALEVLPPRGFLDGRRSSRFSFGLGFPMGTLRMSRAGRNTPAATKSVANVDQGGLVTMSGDGEPQEPFGI